MFLSRTIVKLFSIVMVIGSLQLLAKPVEAIFGMQHTFDNFTYARNIKPPDFDQIYSHETQSI